VLLLALSTGNKIGLGVVGVVFIVFALTASFVAPRRWPEFPGRHGLSVFIIASFVLFAAMLTAVSVFGVESEAQGAQAGAAQGGPSAPRTIDVKESEFRIALPSLATVPSGRYTFVVSNAGQVPHDLVVSGPNVAGPTHTPLIQPGQTQRLTVELATGNYTLYCSIDGHRKLGMVARLAVG
jgi:plastocyanin